MKLIVILRLLTVVLIITLLGGCSKRELNEPGLDKLEPDVPDFENELIPLADSLLAVFNVPGAAIAVILDGEIVLKETTGLANLQSGAALRTDTPFFIASISKTFAGWGALRLVAEGRIDLDAPIENALANWRFPASPFNSDDCTLRLLLAHQGGTSLTGYPGFPPGVPLPTTEESLSGATNGAGDVRLVYRPGSETRYSGGGVTVVQLAIENVSGQSFADYMKENIFQSLGMNDSGFLLTDDLAARLATPYVGLESIDPPRFAALGAAGMISTLDDMTIFAQAIIRAYKGEDVGVPGITRETLDWMLSTPLTADITYQGANQIRRPSGMRTIGHTGGHPGWATIMHIAPEEGHSLIVLTNSWEGLGVHNGLMCRWYEELIEERLGEFCWVFGG